MSEKRLDYDLLWNNYYQVIELDDGDTDYLRRLSPTEIIKRLNEQQATINRMKHSLNTIYKSFEKKFGYDMRNAIWLIDEISYEEWEDKLHIAETDAMNHKESSMYWKNKCDEQQATIRKLQDLCGESDGENAKLRIENKELQEEIKLLKPTNVEQYEQIVQLQEENEQLRKELGDCEKFRYTVFQRLNDEYIKECSIR